MIIGAEIGLAIMGLIALIRGRLQISKSRVVVGVPARLLGLLGLTPLPLAVLAGMVYVAANVNVADPDAGQKFVQEHKGTMTLVEGLTVAAVAVLVFGIGALVASSPDEVARRARRVRDYDDYEGGSDRPVRRRRDESDEAPDRPQRRRRLVDEYEDDDRPRRRRDDLDDRAR